MHRYQPATPRVAIAAVAIAMAAITISVAVIAPAKLDSGNREMVALTPLKVETPTSIEVVIVPAVIEVVAIREPETLKPVQFVPPGQKQQG